MNGCTRRRAFESFRSWRIFLVIVRRIWRSIETPLRRSFQTVGINGLQCALSLLWRCRCGGREKVEDPKNSAVFLRSGSDGSAVRSWGVVRGERGVIRV